MRAKWLMSNSICMLLLWSFSMSFSFLLNADDLNNKLVVRPRRTTVVHKGVSRPLGDVSMTKIAEVGTGNYYDVCVVNSKAYCTHSAGLDILDVSDPSNPQLVGTSLNGSGIVITVQGDNAYVGGENGLEILNISNPNSPTLIGSYGGIEVFDLDMKESAIFLTDGKGLYILDISNPLTPSLVGSYIATYQLSYKAGVKVSGNYAYLTNTHRDFFVLDITDPQNPGLVGTFTNIPAGGTKLEINGNHAFVTGYYVGMLSVVDISNPAIPTLSAEINLSESEDICIRENYAFITCKSSGMIVVDISQPSSPQIKGGCSTSGSCRGLDIAGDYIYIADFNGGFKIVDRSGFIPTSIIGTADTPGSATELCVDGDYAYVADGEGGVQIVDLAEPSNPTVVGGVDTTGQAVDIVVNGSYAYAADGGSGLQVIDVTDPENPSIVGTCDTPGSAKGVDVSGQYAYIADDTSGLQVIDISTPSSPSIVGTLALGGPAMDVVVKDQVAYIAAHWGGLEIVDISVASEPVLLSSLADCGWFQKLEILADTVYGSTIGSTSGSYSIAIVDVSDPENPLYSTSFYHRCCFSVGYTSIKDFAISGYLAYIADENKGMQVLDIEGMSPTSPSPPTVNELDTPGTAMGLAVEGDYTYIADGESGLHVISNADPSSSLTLTGQYDYSQVLTGIALQGNYAYLGDGSSHESSDFLVMDVSTPISPQIVGRLSTPHKVMDVIVNGTYAYVSIFASLLWVVDVSDPSDPNLAATLEVTGMGSLNEGKLFIYGNHLYAACGSNGLAIIDITNPTSPSIVGTYDTDGAVNDACVVGDYAYVADYYFGMDVVDVSTPSAPLYVGEFYYYGHNASDITVDGDYAYMVDKQYIDIIDISNPYAPNYITSYSLTGEFADLTVTGSRLFASHNQSGLCCLDISDPENPSLISSLGEALGKSDLAWFDQKAYLACLSGKFIVVSMEESQISVTTPNGSETWQVGSLQNITWTSTGNIDEVKIEYSTDNGSSWADVDAATDNDGSFEWSVPNAPSTQCLVRISDATDSEVTDTSDTAFSIAYSSTEPWISLNRSRLNFGVESGAQTQSQEVLVSNSGGGTLNWTATDDRTWLGVSPASGIGAAKLTVSVDPTGLDPGTYNGTVTVSDTAATNSPQTVAVTLKVYAAGGSSAPFGSFATPADQAVVQSSIAVTGWALDDVEVVSVKIYREQGENLVYIGDAVFVEGARPDLETSRPDYPLNYRGGWGYMLCTYGLPDQGMSASYTLHVVARDKEGNQTTLGIKTIHCDNQNATKPFGAIATPAQGGEAGGAAFRNWGWALTPPPNMIPTDGSTIRVLVDGVTVGNVIYNLYREDIAPLFPDHLNKDGAAGYFDLDTTAYANGVHTIAWIATDNAANADGIGSRFFTIVNNEGGSSTSSVNTACPATLDADTIRDYMLDPIPVRLSRNGNDPRLGRDIHPEPVSGLCRIEMDVFSPIAVDLNPDKRPGVNFTGYMQVRDELRKLPIGSTLDAENNLFYWQSAPGFYGEYDLVFVDRNRKLVRRICVSLK